MPRGRPREYTRVGEVAGLRKDVGDVKIFVAGVEKKIDELANNHVHTLTMAVENIKGQLKYILPATLATLATVLAVALGLLLMG